VKIHVSSDSDNGGNVEWESWRTPSDLFELELAQLQYERPEDDPDYIPIEQAVIIESCPKIYMVLLMFPIVVV
jgi:hypothetical protein